MAHTPNVIQTVTGSLSADTRGRLARLLDATFFWVGTLTAIWLLWVLTRETFEFGFERLWFLIPMYVLLAYLILPRLHTGLSRIYLPDYFIGRTRTREGILGDPVNLALLGEEAQIHAAMRAAGWTAADPITAKSTWRIIATTLTRKSYAEAPVSDLYVFGKRQDFAYQREVDGNPSQRHHVRFWQAPEGWLLPGGHKVDWVAAGTYDRKVGFSLFTLQVTHKIEQNTDIERDFIVHSIEAADPAAQTTVIKDFSTGYHSRNGGGDNIETDGDLPIVDLTAVAPALTAVSTDTASGGTTHDENQDAEAGLAAGETKSKPLSLIRPVRPIGTALGALLILLRSGAWIGTVFNAFTPAILALAGAGSFNAETGEIKLTENDLNTPGGLVIIALVLLLLVTLTIVPLLLTISVWRGRNWSRVAVMVLSTITIVVAIVAYFNGIGFAEEGGLLGVSLDIGVLLALSGSDARRFTLEQRAFTRTKRSHRAQRRLDRSGHVSSAAAD